MEETINERLRSERKRIRITQQRLADLGGVSLNSQAKYETTDRKPDAVYLSRIWDLLDVPYILTGKKRDQVREGMASYNIPQNDFIGIKEFSPTHTKENEDFHLLYLRRDQLDELNLKAESTIAIYAPDDSMEPDIPNSSIILIDTSKQKVKNGLSYVFNVDDDLLVKKIIREFDGSYIAHSTNPEYADKKLSAEELNSLVLVGQARIAMPLKRLSKK